MKKVKMTAIILAASMTIGGYGVLGANYSSGIVSNVVLASGTDTAQTTTTPQVNNIKAQGIATNQGVISKEGSLKLLNPQLGSVFSNVSVGEMATINNGNIDNGYYKVTIHETGDVGYLKSSDVQEIHNYPDSPLTSLNEDGSIVNVSYAVNVRQGAGLNTDVLTTLHNGKNVKVIGKQGQWYKVQVDGITGYIYQEYISINKTVNKDTHTSSLTNKTINNYASSLISKTVNKDASNSTSKTINKDTSNSASKTINKDTSNSTNKITNKDTNNSINKTVNKDTSNSASKTINKDTSNSTNKITNKDTNNSTNKTINKDTSSSTGVTAQQVLAYAYQFEGYPYVWGGSSPSTGFDCSGFVQYVYAHFGINLPRTTFEQVNCGTPVSLNNIKPGDLVFEFGSSEGPNHVGIYIGNGQMIDAAGVGQGVTISKLYSVVAVRNVL
ncbi:Probable endopeptidase p60 precursor [Sarcina ventriculi]|uniref:NlpC/P60 family protein n=1 Tax=Sarcina ventriculi TaxID=1267 RepID=UPI000D947559|nr:NlpC/P60 family protein [Sarcina ventriculi]SPZ50983.1 Probable endopeptidase p60 precursor [Sarcina ventriculi]